MGSKQPVKKFQAGQVSCTLWENDAVVGGKSLSMYKATLDKRYQDRDGNWRSSQSLSRNEILLAIFVLQKAFEAMIDKSSGDVVERSDVI